MRIALSLCILCGLTASALATPPPRTAPMLEHEFTLLVGVAPKGEEESSKLFNSRRKKTQDEVLRRLLRRYNTIEVRDLKGLPKYNKGSVRMSMRAKRSPGFIQAVALGEGRVSIKPVKHQDELWLVYADPLSDEAASLPDTVRIVDTLKHGLVLESEDAAALQKFTAQFTEFAPQVVLSESSLHMVRSPEKNTWRTLWLGPPKLDTKSVDRVTREQSSHTGATFGQIHLNPEGVTLWQDAIEGADVPLVFVLDDEPVAVVHRPESSSMMTARSEKTRALMFSCDTIWVGPGDVDECTTLASARASSFIPLKIVVGEASKAP